MRKNKKNFEEYVATIETRDCVKEPIENLVFPSFKASRMVSLLFRQVVITKEQPSGCAYDEETYQVVLRIINGRLLINGMLDAYTWKSSKVEDAAKLPVGNASEEGKRNLAKLIESIDSDEEKAILADFFSMLNVDFAIVHTDSEQRKCIEVTQELYDAGLTYSVDEWMKPDDNGEAEATELNVGDFLVVNVEAGTAYCIRREEFLLTHSF